MSRSDSENILLSARVPFTEATATGDIYAEGKKGLVTELTLTAGADVATATFREGGSGGTVLHVISAPANTSVPVDFPSGMLFQDGLHVTLTGTSPSVTGVGFVEQ